MGPRERAAGAALLLVLAVCVWGCSSGSGSCDRASVQQRLDRAAKGDSVELGSCTVTGGLRVPDGVALRGRGPADTVVLGSDGSGVRLGPGASVEGLTVRIERGVAMQARDVATVTVRDVELRGPVTAGTAGELPASPSVEDTATHGLLLVNAGSEDTPVQLTEVSVRGFARFGVLSVDSVVRWEGGDADDNRATGLMAAGGGVTLVEVSLCGTLQGGAPHPAYGGVLRSGGRVSTDRVRVCDSEGFGLLHDDVRASHRDLVGEANAQSALWVQRSDGFELLGAGSRLTDNSLGGFVAVESSGIEVRGLTVEGTRTITTVRGETGSDEIGDGVQLRLATTADLRLEDVALVDNERAGLLIHSDNGEVEPSAVGEVTVRADGDSFGAIAQSPGGVIDSGEWDAQVIREGATGDNDPTFDSPLAAVEAVAPMFLPPEPSP